LSAIDTRRCGVGVARVTQHILGRTDFDQRPKYMTPTTALT
jgi:hypothetical protein